MLTQAQVNHYKENGFLVLKGFYAGAEIEMLREELDSMIAHALRPRIRKNDDVFDLEPGHTPEVPKLRRLLLPYLRHPVYDRAR